MNLEDKVKCECNFLNLYVHLSMLRPVINEEVGTQKNAR